MRITDVSCGRMLAIASGLLMFLSPGQNVLAQELRSINNKFKTEAGCPVDVVSAKTDLEIDPFGTPIACRIYIDYKNTSNKPLNGVKFRIGYIDGDEKVRGTFHAPDAQALSPGSVGKAKWRGERIDPRTAYVLIRVLLARFSDGTEWSSEKLKDLAPGTGGSAGTGGSGSASDTPDSTSDTTGGAASKSGDSTGSSSAAGSSSTGAGAPGESGGSSTSSASSTPQNPGSDKTSDGY